MIKDAMEQSAVDGCQTFDGALCALCARGRITSEEALRAADSPNNLRLRLERDGTAANGAGESPLRLVMSEPQPRRQTMKLQAQRPGPAASTGKGSGAMPAAPLERPKR